MPSRTVKPRKLPRKPATNAGPKLAPKPASGPVGSEEHESELLFDEATPANRIRISRLDDYTKKQVLHGYLSAEEQRESRVAELFGGGDYIAFLIGSNERGAQMILRKKAFTILGPYKRPGAIYGLDPGGTAAVAGAVGVVGDGRVPGPNQMKELIESALFSKVLEMMEKTKGAAFDWGPLITGGLGIVQALLERPKGDEGKSVLLEEVRELRRQLDALRSQPGPAASNIADVLAAVEKIAGARKLFSGRDDEDEPRDPLVAMIAPLLTLLQQGKGTAPVASPPVDPARQVTPGPAADPGPIWVQLLRHYGKDFVAAAKRGTPPSFVAEMALQFVPSEYEGVLNEFCARPDAHTAAMEVIPPLKQFPGWTEKVFTELRRMIQEEEGGDDGEGEEEETT